MRMSVIGVGYLGAVHAAAMASIGHEVVGLDVDASRVEALNSGAAPFFEPNFEELLAEGLHHGTLRFTTHYEDLAGVRVHFLGLGTPQLPGSNRTDLSYINSAIESLLTLLENEAQTHKEAGLCPAPVVIAGKSTVPVGTARELAQKFAHLEHVHFMWNPEFLREGFAVKDTLQPDRLVYGIENPDQPSVAADMLDEVYAPLLAQEIPRLIYSLETAELIKVSANAFLATKISFINAVAEVCEATGADVTHIAEAIGLDDRIGSKFLRAGVGFGGGCLPKDIRAFMARTEELGVGDATHFLREVDAINNRRRARVVELAYQQIEKQGGQLSSARITILGAAFKPDSDDIRDAPALEVAQTLQGHGATVTVTDPQALPNVNARYPSIRTESELSRALKDADLVILATEWKEYQSLDPTQCRELVAVPSMIDARNVLNLQQWRAAGWEYAALGRP